MGERGRQAAAGSEHVIDLVGVIAILLVGGWPPSPMFLASERAGGLNRGKALHSTEKVINTNPKDSLPSSHCIAGFDESTSLTPK